MSSFKLLCPCNFVEKCLVTSVYSRQMLLNHGCPHFIKIHIYCTCTYRAAPLVKDFKTKYSIYAMKFWLYWHLKLNVHILASKILTLQFVMFWIRRKGPIWEKLGKADSRILWLVHHIVPHGLHQPVHKLQTRRAQNLNYLIPLVNVWTKCLLWKNLAVSMDSIV